jgi:hypothetical protein
MIDQVLHSPGLPLDAATRAFMESHFGHDFSNVRVHIDARAAGSAQAVDALAYTVGHNIVFGSGQYAPHTREGKQLLTHELTHVLQQNDPSALTLPSRFSSPDSPVEREAIQNATFLNSSQSKITVSSMPLLFRQPASGKGVTTGKGPTRLYEHRYRGYLITKYSVKAIDFFVGVDESMIGGIERNLDAISDTIVTGNTWISDTTLQVKTCIIAPATTRYATYRNKPVLVLDVSDANSESAMHEIGHAIFNLYRESAAQPKSATKDLGLIIADIFLRLADTKSVQDNERDSSGKPRKAEHPAGLWIADPSQWSKTLASEHPWDDAEEFFASSRKAYLMEQNSLRAAIRKFEKRDPAVGPPAKELLAVLSQLSSGQIPKTSKTLSKDAATHVGGLSRPGKVEDTLGTALREVLTWTLNPSSIPQPQKP